LEIVVSRTNALRYLKLSEIRVHRPALGLSPGLL
jgi:hypothetical protein